ncbi:hypothetical protein NC651_007979 [Populus alba x Populus x berolinensis]|nr:hypothetical protein NC651_007979 [Populus alba x Populus x berolinensis]
MISAVKDVDSSSSSLFPSSRLRETNQILGHRRVHHSYHAKILLGSDTCSCCARASRCNKLWFHQGSFEIEILIL